MDDGSTIGRAFAGHAFRDSGDEKTSAKYDNPLTDFLNLVIAEARAKQSLLINNSLTDDEADANARII